MIEALFNLEGHTITEENIEAIWQLAVIPPYPGDEDVKAKALSLANTNIPAAVEHIYAQHPVVISSTAAAVKDRNAFLEELREFINYSLHNPDTLPKLVPIPTIEDCKRLADTSTEAGRAIAWLLGEWPKHDRPAPAMLGKSTEEGDRWAFLVGDSVSIHERVEKHPYATRQVFPLDGVTGGQLVESARWLLAKAVCG